MTGVDGQPPYAPLAVVIPTRRLEAPLLRRLPRLRAQLAPAEVVIVEPDDAPRDRLTTPAGCRRITARRGRGTQCNTGARASSAPWLLFLHDDTELPAQAGDLLACAMADEALGLACFRLRFDSPHPLLAAYAWFSRFDSFWTTFGDQGYLIRRSLFEAVGGFPDWPLFEDVELPRRVRRLPGPHRRIRKLPAAVTTSAARFDRRGALRQQASNLIAMLRFLGGTPPEQLAAAYERGRTGTAQDHAGEAESGNNRGARRSD